MKKNYTIIIGLFVVAISLFVYASNNKANSTETPPNKEVIGKVSTELPALEFNEQTFDFGVIKQSGGKVSHDFSFKYIGQEPIKITGVPTSCACTSAKITPTSLKSGDSGTVTIVFNPNLHAEPQGKFFKTAIILTEPELSEEVELKIWAEVDLDIGEQAFELKSDHDDEGEEEASLGYNAVTAEILDEMLENKDFVFIDVHIPEQDHIDGTDLFIPYNDIEHYEDKLPQDKNAKIVLYCRSGSMSRAAAYVLAEHGYTNVYDLIGGKIAYDDYIEKR